MTSAPASAWISAWTTELLDGRVVDDLLADQEPVMAVAGVGVERDVDDDADLGHRGLDGAGRGADEIVRVERLRAGRVAEPGVGVGEERDRRDAERRGARRRRATARSTDRRSTPGIDGDRLRSRPRRRPGRSARSGRRRSASFSRTSRRDQSVRRLRRMRRPPRIASMSGRVAGSASGAGRWRVMRAILSGLSQKIRCDPMRRGGDAIPMAASPPSS